MSGVAILALSKWAHFSWLAHGVRPLTERAQAEANAELLARFPQLAAVQRTPAVPRFAALPRPACAKVLRVAAALAYARFLRRVISGEAQRIFAARIAPRVLHAIQRDTHGAQGDVDPGARLNLFDRVEMTAAGLGVALCAVDDPMLRVLVELRVPRIVVQRQAHFGMSDMRIQAARDVLDVAYAIARGEAC